MSKTSKKSSYSKCHGFRHGRYRTSKAKKMDLQRRVSQSLQIRVLTVVSAKDELFIKLLSLTLYILTLAEDKGFVKLYYDSAVKLISKKIF